MWGALLVFFIGFSCSNGSVYEKAISNLRVFIVLVFFIFHSLIFFSKTKEVGAAISRLWIASQASDSGREFVLSEATLAF